MTRGSIDRVPRRLTTASLGLAAGELAGMDPDLGTIVERHGVPPMWGRNPGFATLVRIILEQQVSLAAAIREVKGLDALPSRAEQADLAAQWAPWRSVAARILWVHYLG